MTPFPAHTRGSRPPGESIRILHIIPDLSLAGAETKLYKLLMAADRRRFTHSVISLRDGGELKPGIEALGITVSSLGMTQSLAGPASLQRLRVLVRRLNPELIHGWMYHGNLAAQVAARFARNEPKVIWSVHQSLYNFALEKPTTVGVIKLGALLSKRPDRIIYISQTSARQHAAAGFNDRKAMVLYYGFDTDTFAPSAEARRSLRAELNLAPETFLIGLVGRYHPVKDHATFLRACALLHADHPEVKFVLCGKRVDESNSALLQLARELLLSDHVHLLGQRRDVPRVTAALDLAASSSSTEGFPNVIGEAMSSGVPCVATDVSDLATIVGETGRVVPP